MNALVYPKKESFQSISTNNAITKITQKSLYT